AFKYNPECAPQCAIPLSEFSEFCEPDMRIGLNGVDQLTSFGSELMNGGLTEMTRFAREIISDPEQYQFWAPHAVSSPLWRQAAEQLNLGERLYSKVFPRYGNLVSASVPAGIAMAIEEGAIERGERIVLCPASAGTSMTTAPACRWPRTASI